MESFPRCCGEQGEGNHFHGIVVKRRKGIISMVLWLNRGRESFPWYCGEKGEGNHFHGIMVKQRKGIISMVLW